jgi:hypothetical protein
VYMQRNWVQALTAIRLSLRLSLRWGPSLSRVRAGNRVAVRRILLSHRGRIPHLQHRRLSERWGGMCRL